MPDVDALTLRNKILGVLIRGARLKSGRTLEECAAAVGIKPGLLAAYEEGRKEVSLPEVELLAYFLDKPVTSFWGDGEAVIEPEPAPPPERVVALRQRIIGILLRQARRKARKQLQDLAAMLGCSSRMVGKYERGERPIPLAHLELLSEHLGVPMSYFLDEGIGTLGERELDDRLYDQFRRLPDELRSFVVQPINESYLRVAHRLAEMPAGELRSIAEGI
ncbi:MAG: transcriptional regulator, partial [Thermoflexales bacterium]|nr:transcriptional regulator [Thermoflexales bacterium]